MASVAGDVVWTGGGECRWTCGVMEFAEFYLFILGIWFMKWIKLEIELTSYTWYVFICGVYNGAGKVR